MTSHPLCPECGYDLHGTVAARQRICPECGCDFEAARRELGLDAGWSEGRGLRGAVVMLVLRAAFAVPLVAGLVLFVPLVVPAERIWTMSLIYALAGIALGRAIERGLPAHAGYEGPAVTVLAFGAAWAFVAAAAGMAAVLDRPDDLADAVVPATVAVMASVYIARERWM